MIEFHLETRSGVPTYLQLVQQVRQAVRLGILHPGDQLPTVKEVVEKRRSIEHCAARLRDSIWKGSSVVQVWARSSRAGVRRCRRTT
jgi:hypothetical protein